MHKHTPSMFLTDFRMQKYTGAIISQVGIFLTVTPASHASMTTSALKKNSKRSVYELSGLIQFSGTETSWQMQCNTISSIFIQTY